MSQQNIKMQKILQQGAEAIISLDKNNNIIKHRIKKLYRIPEIDEKLRFRRTKSEAKIIEKLKSIINVPKIIQVDKEDIIMEHIKGKKLSDFLEKLNYKEICKQIGQTLTKLHNQNIVHGDLTTSNMIYAKNKNVANSENSKTSSSTHEQIKNSPLNYQNNKNQNQYKLYFIDFGLGFHSLKIEDKAVDLHLIQQALNAKHFKIANECFKIILKNYTPNQKQLIIERISAIEKRGRYRH